MEPATRGHSGDPDRDPGEPDKPEDADFMKRARLRG